MAKFLRPKSRFRGFTEGLQWEIGFSKMSGSVVYSMLFYVFPGGRNMFSEIFHRGTDPDSTPLVNFRRFSVKNLPKPWFLQGSLKNVWPVPAGMRGSYIAGKLFQNTFPNMF